MDLKSTIDNTNKHTNDLKLARNKINDKIISGGGTIADTLNAVPDAIDKMLKENYKKVAIINTEQFTLPSQNESKDFKIPIAVNFNPSICYLQLIPYSDEWQIREAFDIKAVDYLYTTLTYISNVKMTQNEITFNYQNKNSLFTKIKFKIIAIE